MVVVRKVAGRVRRRRVRREFRRGTWGRGRWGRRRRETVRRAREEVVARERESWADWEGGRAVGGCVLRRDPRSLATRDGITAVPRTPLKRKLMKFMVGVARDRARRLVA